MPDPIQDEYYDFFSLERDQSDIETFISNHPNYQDQLRQIVRLQQQAEIENKIVAVVQEELRPVALKELIIEVKRLSARLDFDTILRATKILEKHIIIFQ